MMDVKKFAFSQPCSLVKEGGIVMVNFYNGKNITRSFPLSKKDYDFIPVFNKSCWMADDSFIVNNDECELKDTVRQYAILKGGYIDSKSKELIKINYK